VGNAFPPPVAEAVGGAIRRALRHEGDPYPLTDESAHLHDPVFAVLRVRDAFLTAPQIAAAVRAEAAARGRPVPRLSGPAVLRRLEDLSRDFHVETAYSRDGLAYRLGEFRAFLGQPGHVRHEQFSSSRATIS
jgi:DNA (cytosine-5)-methyltransferase 1